VFHVNYLGGDMPVFQINCFQPAGQIVASYYNFLRLGHEGYPRMHQASYEIEQFSPQRSSSWVTSTCFVRATRTPESQRSPGGAATARTRVHAVRPGHVLAHPEANRMRCTAMSDVRRIAPRGKHADCWPIGEETLHVWRGVAWPVDSPKTTS
jgi:hypothetical protein